MKKGLYIGIYTEGSTSKMRADTLKKMLPGWSFDVIDTDVPFNRFGRIFRSIGFRYKVGPVIGAVNQYVINHLGKIVYDLVWVDKAIFLSEKTTAQVKRQATRLVHFTPDTAFISNRSHLFYASIRWYDFLVTTKSFELQQYYNTAGKEKVILKHQGYDHTIHKPWYDFNEKKNQVVFVGLCEPSREKIIGHLLDNGIKVVLAGKKWDNFLKKYKGNPHFEYRGHEIRDEAYAKLISSSYFGLGLLSKKFPELHTTRTFEIPACGTVLLTEKNPEIEGFFSGNEVIYYNDATDLVNKIRYYEANKELLNNISDKGFEKVTGSGKSYESLIRSALASVLS